jgi:3-oxosteroid 1-dehydrogenase
MEARHGVLLAAGGFARNVEMRQKYSCYPLSEKSITAANPGDTGEVIQMALEMGADADCMDEAWWLSSSLGPGGTFPPEAILHDGTLVPFIHIFDIALPHAIVVDQDGRRFGNEGGAYMEFVQLMYERQRATGRAIPAWAIIESRHRSRYPWGSVLGKTPQHWFDSGYIKRADTLEELARQCGIDPAGLESQVNRFNEFARVGRDTEFDRGNRIYDRQHGDPTVGPNPTLGPIERPPFYAFSLFPGDVGTSGGLVTDENAAVLQTDGSVIPGLYATGNTTASVFGRSYPGAGSSIAATCVFGYVAATQMLSQSV